MAAFPTIKSSPGDATGAFRPYVVQGQALDLSGIAKAASRVVEDFRQKDKAESAARDGLRSVEAEGKYQMGLQEFSSTLDPEDPDYVTKFTEHANELRDDAVANTPFELEDAKTDFVRRTTGYTMNALSQGLAQRRQLLAEKAITVRDRSENATLNAIRANPDAADAVLADHGEQAARFNLGIPPHVREKMDNSFADQAVVSHALGYADKGDFERARQVLASADGVDPKTIASANAQIRTVEGEQRSERRRQNSFIIADLSEQIASGSLTNPKELDRYAEAGVFNENPIQKVTLLRQIQTEQRRQAAEARAEARQTSMLAALQGPDYSDPNSQKTVDLTWKRGLASQNIPMDADDPNFLRYAKTFVANGVTPTPVKNYLERMSQSSDPADMSRAAKLYMGLRQAGPNNPMPKNETMEQVSYYVEKANVPLDKAIEMVAAANGNRPDTAAATARFNDFARDLNKDAGKGWAKRAGEALGVDEDLVTPSMIDQYVDISKRFFLANGQNFDAATGAAATAMQNRSGFGTTSVGGADTLTHFPVETMTRVASPGATPLFDQKEITKIYDDAIRQMLAAAPPAVLAGDKDPWAVSSTGVKPYEMLADDTTRDEAAANKRLTYRLYKRNEYGAMEPARDGQGKFIRVPVMDDATFRAQAPVKARIDAGTVEAAQQRRAELERERWAIDHPMKGGKIKPVITPEEAARLKAIDEELSTIPKQDTLSGVPIQPGTGTDPMAAFGIETDMGTTNATP